MKATTLRVAGRHPRSEPRLEDIDSAPDLSLGSSRFIEYHLLKPLREWDGENFDTYDPPTESRQLPFSRGARRDRSRA